MTGPGGATSAPPAINHQGGKQWLRVVMNRRTDKTPACGVHGSNHEGVNDAATRLSRTGPTLVAGQGGATNNMPGHGVHDATMNPFMTVPMRVHHEGMALKPPIPADDQNKVRTPDFLPSSLHANKPPESTAADRRPTCGAAPRNRPILVLAYLVGEAFGLLTGTELSGRDCGFPCRRAVVTSLLRRPNRTAKKDREPVGPTVSLASAPIMKVAARHEAESKMVKQVPCLRERCRWPRSRTVPEVSSGSLRWAR